MPRHVRARLRIVAASAVLATGLTPLLPSTAAADTPQETVVPATLRSTYTSGSLYSGSTYAGRDGAGAQGVFHSLEGFGLVWTRYADGTSTRVVHPTGHASFNTAGGDTLAYRYADGRVDLWNAADGTTRTVRTPEGLSYLTAYSDLGVAYRQWRDESGTTRREMHLLSPETDGSTRDVTVNGLPEQYTFGMPKGGDADGLLFLAGRPGGGEYVWVMVDKRTGQVQSITPPRAEVYRNAQVTTDHVVLFNLDDPTVQVYSRADLSATPVEVTLDGSGLSPTRDLAVVGDWLVHGSGTAVIAKPLAGGSSVTLLSKAHPAIGAVSDGTAVAVGRTSDTTDDWGVQRIQPGPDGRPVVTQVKSLAQPPRKIQGLSLDQGRLVVADFEKQGSRDAYGRTVAATGTPEFGQRSQFTGSSVLLGDCEAADVACAQVRGVADGRIAWLEHDGETDRIRVGGPGGSDFWERTGLPSGGRIADVSGDYLIHTTDTRQTVYQIDDNSVVPRHIGAPVASALSGDTLWLAGETPGTVTAYDVTAKRTVETLTTDAGCTPTDLQAVGRWLYWTCDGRAGVFDRTAGRSVPVPPGESGLGDGFVVTHDKEAGKLVLTAVADGTPSSRVIGDLPDTGVSQRDVRWTVDESGANAAYVDEQERVHLVPSGVAQQPLRLLRPVRSAATHNADMTHPDLYPLTTVLLSKPAAGWRLILRDKATGRVVDTVDGGAARGELKVGWDGAPGTGTVFAPNGVYDWTLSVTPADGVGAPLETRGTVRLQRGAAVYHDYAGLGLADGTGDLLTLAGGTLSVHEGTGRGTFTAPLGSWGWPTKMTAVAVGDLSGDRCNDFLVRESSGAARLYKPGCDEIPEPTTPNTTLATSGWNTFDIVTSPGDITGDGRPDLIARKAATGIVYLYKGTSAGRLASGVKLYADWRTYKKVVGAGDLNGDGVGDLLTQDKANNLFRFFGRSNGTFAPGVKLYANWGAPYNALVGVGDTTGDGKADLVARDTAGVLYRIPGNGKGSFSPRVKIATGWQSYTIF
ncbi:FG-GAP-like repeat-containing protein [Streptomyces sp. NPDC006527]|uniref:FG-GAP-like repeat-containing protein n=1 Tax=Streptomyces sp. NPDC006527 TaxID=3364749 RepID=UPI0036A2F9C0